MPNRLKLPSSVRLFAPYSQGFMLHRTGEVIIAGDTVLFEEITIRIYDHKEHLVLVVLAIGGQAQRSRRFILVEEISEKLAAMIFRWRDARMKRQTGDSMRRKKLIERALNALSTKL